MKEADNTNYNQPWAREIVAQFRKAWNGQLAPGDFTTLFSASFVFHYHDKVIKGMANYQKFITIARTSTRGLDLHIETTFAFKDKILLYFRWSSSRWHKDIKGGNTRSNFGKIVFRIQEGKIAEKWQQAPDFIYLLGKGRHTTAMDYPAVLPGKFFIEKDNRLYVGDDADTILMSDLFKKMNDCFFGLAPIGEISDALNSDMRYENGHIKGEGIASWKTFAYALHSAFGAHKPRRYDDLYIRSGDRMKVITRIGFQATLPSVLAGANGMVAILEFEIKNNKIQHLYTHLENYLSFLDTDFNAHQARLEELFRGGPMPVAGHKEAKQNIKISAQEQRQEKQQQEKKTATAHGQDQVAIVGIAGRFPQCDSVEAYWQMLLEGKSAFSGVSEARPYLKKAGAKVYAGLLDEVDRFDAGFFNISALEAEYMDPQHRLLMEVIWHSMEDSAHPSEDYSGERTGIFVSSISGDYKKLLQDHHAPVNEYYWMGNETAMFPAKIARFFNIQGPCKFINTECTSAFVAIHEASRLIRSGEINQAIVGATNLLLHPYGFRVRAQTLLSPEEQPYIFSRESQGQLRGEAVVSVILKSMTKALEDQDRIYGIVSGSAVNNSGETFSVIAPNVEKQAQVITEAWDDASVTPSDMSLIECHASGIREGDFAEIAAIKKAFNSRKIQADAAGVCRLSAVKGAIGHAEGASGLTTLVKVLLQLKHRLIPGIQGLGETDPGLGIAQSRLRLVQENTRWERSVKNGGEQPRFAGINAFATGGYNAHMVIKEYPGQFRIENSEFRMDTSAIMVLSAKAEDRLKAQAKNLKSHLQQNKETNLYDLAYTLQIGRDAMETRLAFISNSVEETINSLNNYIQGNREDLFAGNIKKDRSDFLLGGAMQEQLTLKRRFPKNRSKLWPSSGSGVWR